MKEMTAHHFATRFYAVRPGDVALVNAAIGGVGQTQMIRLLDGRVFARVSTEGNAQIARAGADHVIVESGGNFAKEVLQLTSGEGGQVLDGGSGSVTFDDSLATPSRRAHVLRAGYRKHKADRHRHPA
jgi:NADPH2:quinone reductase